MSGRGGCVPLALNLRGGWGVQTPGVGCACAQRDACAPLPSFLSPESWLSSAPFACRSPASCSAAQPRNPHVTPVPAPRAPRGTQRSRPLPGAAARLAPRPAPALPTWRATARCKASPAAASLPDAPSTLTSPASCAPAALAGTSPAPRCAPACRPPARPWAALWPTAARAASATTTRTRWRCPPALSPPGEPRFAPAHPRGDGCGAVAARARREALLSSSPPAEGRRVGGGSPPAAEGFLHPRGDPR